jgi:hypothetical protein
LGCDGCDPHACPPRAAIRLGRNACARCGARSKVVACPRLSLSLAGQRPVCANPPKYPRSLRNYKTMKLSKLVALAKRHFLIDLNSDRDCVVSH